MSTRRYALVGPDDTIIRYGTEAPNVDQSKLAKGKPRWLPVEEAGEMPATDDRSELAGQTASVVGGKVVIGWETKALTIAQRKERMHAAIRARRWEVEVGGVVVNDAPIRTDETSQAKIAGAISLFDKDPTLSTIDWEAAPGIWVALDKTTVEAIGVAVGRHVQAAFSQARALGEAVESAGTHAALDAIDITEGWGA